MWPSLARVMSGLQYGAKPLPVLLTDDALSIGPPGKNWNEIWIKILNFSFKKMHLNMPSENWRAHDISPRSYYSDTEQRVIRPGPGVISKFKSSILFELCVRMNDFQSVRHYKIYFEKWNGWELFFCPRALGVLLTSGPTSASQWGPADPHEITPHPQKVRQNATVL